MLSMVRDLGDDKLLRLKTEIVDKIEDAKYYSDQAVASVSQQISSLAEASQDQKVIRILRSLDFVSRRSRQSAIDEIEARTFNWLFDDHQRSGFKHWLRRGDNIYWISGKAGSGKSVLMNYIASEPRTREFLRPWAGTKKLVIAKYFFWNSGASMQKSQEGLMQSLLYEVCCQCPELIPLICPRWSRFHDIDAAWSRSELIETFRNLRLNPKILSDVKLCFFIDGVDEYGGENLQDIIDVLQGLNASPSLKICLSSRPWNLLISAFGINPNQALLLEDHNGGDIEEYVRNRFERGEKVAPFQLRGPDVRYVVDYIVHNAQGIFLWVKIVANNLLRRLSNGDSFSDLDKRLKSFPTNLTAYFQHMLDDIDDFIKKRPQRYY